MNTQTVRNILYTGFTLILIFVQTGCAGSAPTAPTEAAISTETAILNTSMPMATSTPADTPTPQATATFTETPAPTPTFTPNVTATLLPELTPAVEGKGNVIGLVLWNNQPVRKAAVWLCEKFEGGCKGVYQYRVNTDENGYYVFKNVTPGKYLVAINSFSTSWFIFYFDATGNKELAVSAGQDLILDPWNIWKFDLQPVARPAQDQHLNKVGKTGRQDHDPGNKKLRDRAATEHIIDQGQSHNRESPALGNVERIVDTDEARTGTPRGNEFFRQELDHLIERHET